MKKSEWIEILSRAKRKQDEASAEQAAAEEAFSEAWGSCYDLSLQMEADQDLLDSEKEEISTKILGFRRHANDDSALFASTNGQLKLFVHPPKYAFGRVVYTEPDDPKLHEAVFKALVQANADAMRAAEADKSTL